MGKKLYSYTFMKAIFSSYSTHQASYSTSEAINPGPQDIGLLTHYSTVNFRLLLLLRKNEKPYRPIKFAILSDISVQLAFGLHWLAWIFVLTLTLTA